MILRLRYVFPKINYVLKKDKALQLKRPWALVLDPHSYSRPSDFHQNSRKLFLPDWKGHSQKIAVKVQFARD